MSKKRLFSKKGFTLIELLVVIAIVGVLSSVVLVSLNTARDKSRYSHATSQLVEIEKALELYYSNNGQYPADVGPGAAPPGLIPTYLAVWPDPPCPGWTYDYQNWSSGSRILTSIYTEPPWINKGARCHYIAPGFSCPSSGFGEIREWVDKTLRCER